MELSDRFALESGEPDASRITVVIPYWDLPEEWLRIAVDSVREQEEPARILVVDNCSSVPIPELEGVEVVRIAEQGTVGVARNIGLEHVTTGLVAFLDADDRMLPGSLRYLRGLIDEHPEAHGVQGRQHLWFSDESKEVLDRWPYLWMRWIAKRLQGSRRASAFLAAIRCNFPMHGALLRTEAVREAGGFADWRQAQDWALLVSMSLRGRMIQTRVPTYAYRRQLQTATLSTAPRRDDGTRARGREVWRLPSRTRADVRARILQHLINEPATSGWLKIRPTRWALAALHHLHEVLIRCRVTEVLQRTSRRLGIGN